MPSTPEFGHPYFESRAHTLAMADSPLGPLTIHYRVHGEGPPLLLVHGLMTSGYSFRRVLDGLGARHRLFIPDLPGCGRSSKPRGPYTQTALAAWLDVFQRALGLRGCAVVGNSLGGCIAMQLALTDGGSFSRIVNIHAPAAPEPRYLALGTALAVPGVRRALAWWIRRDPERWAHRNVHYFDERLKSLEEAREYGEPLRAAGGAEAFTHYLSDALSFAGFRGFVGELARRRACGQSFPAPLLLLYARRDPLVDAANGRLLHRLVPGSRLVWIDDSSHFAHVDTPEVVVSQVTAFLAEAAAAP